jgi:hypothetical protein
LKCSRRELAPLGRTKSREFSGFGLDDGLCGRNPSKPDRTITSGFQTIHQEVTGVVGISALVLVLVILPVALDTAPIASRARHQPDSRNVGLVGSYMCPSSAIITHTFEAHSKFRKRGLQESDHQLHVMHAKARM